MRFPLKEQTVPQCICTAGKFNPICPWYDKQYHNPYQAFVDKKVDLLDEYD